MRSFHYFSLAVIIASAAITYNALAMPMKVHMLDNLSPHELSIAKKVMAEKGYLISDQPIFKDSKEVVVITKNLGLDGERESIKFEVVRQKDKSKLPKSVFSTVVETSDIEKALKEKLPAPDKLKNSSVDEEPAKPVALSE